LLDGPFLGDDGDGVTGLVVLVVIILGLVLEGEVFDVVCVDEDDDEEDEEEEEDEDEFVFVVVGLIVVDVCIGDVGDVFLDVIFKKNDYD